MSTHDDVQSSRREQRNQPSRLIRSRRLRWLGGRSRASEQAERTGPASQGGQVGQVGQPSQGGQAGQAGMVGLGGATSQDGGLIPGIQPLEMAAADFGNLRAPPSAVEAASREATDALRRMLAVLRDENMPPTPGALAAIPAGHTPAAGPGPPG